MAAIGLYEISTHQHNFYYFLQIAVAAGHDVTAFTHEETAETVSEMLGSTADEVTWVRKSDDESVGDYLSRVERVCNDRLDLFIAQSLYPQTAELPSYLRFTPDCKRLLWIYNVNRWLDTGLSVRQDLTWNVHMFLRRRLLSKFDGLCVQYAPMAKYIRDNFTLSKPVYVLPTTLHEDVPETPSGRIRFTVPGQVEAKRRDYELVLDVFEDLFERHDAISLHLLGRPNSEYGDRIVHRCEALVEVGYNVVFHREWIPREEYDQSLRTSSVLLCPLRETISGRGVAESYGTTKGSGNVFDALRNATPLVLPSSFEVDDIIDGSALSYNDAADLRAQLDELIAEPKQFQSLRERARTNAEQFRLEPQCERFDEIVHEFV